MNDDFFLAWLARECRFQASIHFAPRTRIGYRIVRRIIVSPKDEAELNMWLSTKGITARIIKDKEQIMKVIRLLAPVKQYVKDINGMGNMLKILEVNKRRATHQDILNVIAILE
jgi:hypothetical protein|tara:strand:+ start:643 stop:984 length:342 start_codon:yes stop_codon:yes gene_type:complete